MSYSGYDIEDAVMVNKAAMDRGFGRSMYYRRYETVLKKYDGGIVDAVVGREVEEESGKVEGKPGKRGNFGNKRLHGIDESGMARVGVPLRSGDVYVNKKVPVIPAEAYKKGMMYDIKPQDLSWKDEPSVFKGNKPLYVDRIVLSTN